MGLSKIQELAAQHKEQVSIKVLQDYDLNQFISGTQSIVREYIGQGAESTLEDLQQKEAVIINRLFGIAEEIVATHRLEKYITEVPPIITQTLEENLDWFLKSAQNSLNFNDFDFAIKLALGCESICTHLMVRKPVPELIERQRTSTDLLIIAYQQTGQEIKEKEYNAKLKTLNKQLANVRNQEESKQQLEGESLESSDGLLISEIENDLKVISTKEQLTYKVVDEASLVQSLEVSGQDNQLYLINPEGEYSKFNKELLKLTNNNEASTRIVLSNLQKDSSTCGDHSLNLIQKIVTSNHEDNYKIGILKTSNQFGSHANVFVVATSKEIENIIFSAITTYRDEMELKDVPVMINPKVTLQSLSLSYILNDEGVQQNEILAGETLAQFNDIYSEIGFRELGFEVANLDLQSTAINYFSAVAITPHISSIAQGNFDHIKSIGYEGGGLLQDAHLLESHHNTVVDYSKGIYLHKSSALYEGKAHYLNKGSYVEYDIYLGYQSQASIKTEPFKHTKVVQEQATLVNKEDGATSIKYQETKEILYPHGKEAYVTL